MKYSVFLKRSLLILLTLLLAVSSFLLTAQAASVSDFTDVSSSDWYYDAVHFAATNGLFQGTSSTTFSPNVYMERRMFITVLGRYAGVDPTDWLSGTITGSSVRMREGPGTNYDLITYTNRNDSVTILGASGNWYKVKYGSLTGYISADYVSPDHHVFVDVSFDDYCAGYAVWGYEIGIVDGYGSADYFAPQYCITREEICCLLERYIEYAGLTYEEFDGGTDFADRSSISSWATEAVATMQNYGIVQGEVTSSGCYFRPGDSATRAEVATMFMRLHSYAKKPAVTPTPTPTPSPGTSTGGEDRAEFLSSTISVPFKTVRVGLYISTKSYHTCVSSVTLYNSGGTSFEYGSYNTAREFVSAGTISSRTIYVTTDGTTFTVKDASGNTVHTTSSVFAVRPVSTGSALTQINSGNRYYGGFEFRQAYYDSGKITLINYVDIDDYVKGVIPYEYGTSWPAETLKAGAITARNFVATYDLSIYRSYGFDLTNTVQVYRGRASGWSDSSFSATDSAVNATKNIYLTYTSNGTNRLCETYYFSSDGGATEDSAHIWGGSYSYLIGKIDPYEAAASSLASYYKGTYTQTRTGSKMTSLAGSLGLGTIAPNGIKIETYSDTGNVCRIVITDVNGKTATISQHTSFDRWDFLNAFGCTAYSYRYEVAYNQTADTFTVTKHGWGHNVGLSQWGAYSMAKYYNKDYQDILGFYFDGTHLQYGVN